jgi:hypothetical protein
MAFDKVAWSEARYQERKAELALRRADPEWKAKRKAWVKKHREQNREKLNAYDKERYHKDPKRRKKSVTKEQKKKWNRNYRLKHLENKKAKDNLYYQNNKERVKANSKRNMYRRLKTDPQFKLRCDMRARILMALKFPGGKKAAETMELLGCTIPELEKHLESKFKPGMTWANRGRFGWHVDHVRPISSFDLFDPEQQKICFHYTNLQPLWWRENISKGAKYAPA